ncbi:hypothetical protein FKM82_008440 [Ascaphus truei]
MFHKFLLSLAHNMVVGTEAMINWSCPLNHSTILLLHHSGVRLKDLMGQRSCFSHAAKVTCMIGQPCSAGSPCYAGGRVTW